MGLLLEHDSRRALHAEGFDRSRIAEALGLRYQHVYNVLTQSGRKTDRVAERPSASAAWLEQPVAAAPAGLPVRVVMDAARRVTIPDTLAEAVGISAGDDVLLCQEGDELRLYGQEAAIRRVQRLVAQPVRTACRSGTAPASRWRGPPGFRC